MKILALITARSGSKRLPGKNIRLLGGEPLIVWTINAVNGIAEICHVLVSTDDSEIAQISKKSGAYVPWLRPEGLASDTASSVDVALHALDFYEDEHGSIDGLLLLQPTSPMRSCSTIIKAIELYRDNQCKSIVSVSLANDHPMWTFKINKNYLTSFIGGNNFDIRSQDLLPAYVLNGAIYLVSPKSLRKNHSFIDDHTIPLIMQSQIESLDIDTEFDFKLAEYFLELKS